ncbi:MAG TPA: hypothetical protein VFW90_01145 [Candidatus Saccharimonadales bacterium]|nr:hypothetical protein [Candidatus Saccharimonadales bacterium]
MSESRSYVSHEDISEPTDELTRRSRRLFRAAKNTVALGLVAAVSGSAPGLATAAHKSGGNEGRTTTASIDKSRNPGDKQVIADAMKAYSSLYKFIEGLKHSKNPNDLSAAMVIIPRPHHLVDSFLGPDNTPLNDLISVPIEPMGPEPAVIFNPVFAKFGGKLYLYGYRYSNNEQPDAIVDDSAIPAALKSKLSGKGMSQDQIEEFQALDKHVLLRMDQVFKNARVEWWNYLETKPRLKKTFSPDGEHLYQKGGQLQMPVGYFIEGYFGMNQTTGETMNYADYLKLHGYNHDKNYKPSFLKHIK